MKMRKMQWMWMCLLVAGMSVATGAAHGQSKDLVASPDLIPVGGGGGGGGGGDDGCGSSPENPTAILGLVGAAGMGGAVLRQRLSARRKR